MSIQDKLTTITENVPKVYEAGIAEGKKAQYDAYWDSFQINGTRTSYYYAFDKHHFNSDIFYPKYDIRPAGSCERMFYAWGDGNLWGEQIFNLKARLEECGVVLDTSKVTNLTNAFAYCTFTEIPTIDLTGLTVDSAGIFSHSYGNNVYQMSIEKIIISETTPIASSWFTNNTALKNVIFEGVIGKSGLNLAPCYRLNKASFVSVIECLSTTTSGMSVSLSKTAVDREFQTSSGSNDGSTSAEWQALVATKPNWTINLA